MLIAYEVEVGARLKDHCSMGVSEATTRGVYIQVESTPDPARSMPEQDRWFFLYTVTISNEGNETVRLKNRHWVITDGDGHVQEVRGSGVVGEQPVLKPGQSFKYTSGCPLRTAFGFMRGTYTMLTEDGESFEAQIADFELSEPYAIN